jgi:coenzyme F420-0:L-glutamate ligase/coenzyme F420-1:gamma-L-glutamate ligase
MFGYGAREAVVRALRGDPVEQGPFGAPAAEADLVAALRDVLGARADVRPDGGVLLVGDTDRVEAVRALAFAHGWVVATPPAGETPFLLRLVSSTP